MGSRVLVQDLFFSFKQGPSSFGSAEKKITLRRMQQPVFWLALATTKKIVAWNINMDPADFMEKATIVR